MSEHVPLLFLLSFPKDKNYSIVMKIPLHKTCVTEAPFRKQHGFYQKLKTWAKFLLVYFCKHVVHYREVLGKGPKPLQVTSIFPECLLGTACLSHGQPCAPIHMSGKQKLSKSNIKKHQQKNDNWLSTHINHQKKLGDASLGTWFSPLGHVGISSEQRFLAIYAVAPADVTIHYPLVLKRSYGESPCLKGTSESSKNIYFHGPFSMVMLNNQRVLYPEKMMIHLSWTMMIPVLR